MTRALNKGRGLRPGDTRKRRFVSLTTPELPTLNKGRGLRPGDTSLSEACQATASGDDARSTKAGAFAPATHGP